MKEKNIKHILIYIKINNSKTETIIKNQAIENAFRSMRYTIHLIKINRK